MNQEVVARNQRVAKEIKSMLQPGQEPYILDFADSVGSKHCGDNIFSVISLFY